MTINLAVLSSSTKKLLYHLTELDVLQNFYLAGGTALALQLGHGRSDDLDFFSASDLSFQEIKKQVATETFCCRRQGDKKRLY